MSLNTAHANRGVLLYSGEYILIYVEDVQLEFEIQKAVEFQSSKKGRIYLTTHRVIFINNTMSESMKSFSIPFVTMRQLQLEYPPYGTCRIKGRVVALKNGNFKGKTSFCIRLLSGGTPDFYKALLSASNLANWEEGDYCLVAYITATYEPPRGPWYAAPPPSYYPPVAGFKGWKQPDEFPMAPKPDDVFSIDDKPLFKGLQKYEADEEFKMGEDESIRSSLDYIPPYPYMQNKYGEIAGFAEPYPPGFMDGRKRPPRPPSKMETVCPEEETKQLIWI